MKTPAKILTLLALLATSAARAADPSNRVEVERSVDRALKRLAETQQPDGSWSTRIDIKSTAVTSLCVLAFLARGHLPGQGEYGDAINKAIDNVLATQVGDGLLADVQMGHTMYDHGISTVMLCEVYGMVSGKNAAGVERRVAIEKAVGKSIKLILAAQQIPKASRDQGGWRYYPTDTDSDISVTSWQLMALRGAGNVGAAIPKKAIDDGIAYISRLQDADGGFSYNATEGPSPGRTASGVLALQLLGQHDSPKAKLGGQRLLDAVSNKHAMSFANGFYYYTLYYCAQAAFQLGDVFDREINAYIRNALLKTQKDSGGWSPGGATAEGQVGEPYATALAVLALSVQFHYLPLYQLK